MSKNANTLNKKSLSQALAQFSKDWMSIIGLLGLIAVFTIASLIKFKGEQYFLTWGNWKNICVWLHRVKIRTHSQINVFII